MEFDFTKHREGTLPPILPNNQIPHPTESEDRVSTEQTPADTPETVAPASENPSTESDTTVVIEPVETPPPQQLPTHSVPPSPPHHPAQNIQQMPAGNPQPNNIPTPASDPYHLHNLGYNPQQGYNPQEEIIFTPHTRSIENPAQHKPTMGVKSVLAKIMPFVDWKKSDEEKNRDHMIELIGSSLGRSKTFGVLSLKGGVGKSVSTNIIGSTFALHRSGARGVIGLDVDKYGTLAERTAKNTPSSIITVADDPNITTTEQIEASSVKNTQGFYALASKKGSSLAGISPSQYNNVLKKVAKSFDIVLVDCSPSAEADALPEIIKKLDGLFIITNHSKESIDLSLILIDLLPHIGRPDLIHSTIMLITNTNRREARMNLDQVVADYEGKGIKNVFLVPFDTHIEEGDIISYDLLHKDTRLQYMKACATMMTRINRR